MARARRMPEEVTNCRRGNEAKTIAVMQRPRNLDVHHRDLNDRFTSRTAKTHQMRMSASTFLFTCHGCLAPISAGPGQRARSRKRTPCRRNALGSVGWKAVIHRSSLSMSLGGPSMRCEGHCPAAAKCLCQRAGWRAAFPSASRGATQDRRGQPERAAS